MRTVKLKGGEKKEVPCIVGLRDRALIGLMVFTFARVGAAVGMKIEEYFIQGRRGWVRLHEKGGKRHDVPANHHPPVLTFQRTECNVRDSDGTAVFSLAPHLAGGSLKTVEFARKHNRPLIHVSAVDPDPAGRLQRFLEDNVIDTLNIAGPRKSKEPG
jgi:hypothetical protein